MKKHYRIVKKIAVDQLDSFLYIRMQLQKIKEGGKGNRRSKFKVTLYADAAQFWIKETNDVLFERV